MTILLVGSNGQLGARLAHALPALGRTVAVGRSELDLAHADAIRALLREVKPAVIVNAAAYTAVDRAETERELAMQVNGVAPGILAEEARRLDALLVHYSTDYVFDGVKPTPYTESDACRPVNFYGASKLAGEQAVAASGCAHLILRTSWVYDVRGENFVLTMLRLARERAELRVVSDQTGSPTWARALSEATLALLRDQDVRGKSGLYHLAAQGGVSRYDLTLAIIEAGRRHVDANAQWARVKPIATSEYPLPAQRPLSCVMNQDKVRAAFGIAMDGWGQQLEACVAELGASLRRA